MAKKAKKSTAEPAVFTRLRNHFSTTPGDLPVLQEQFAGYERPNLQLALDELLNEPDRNASFVGLVSSSWDEPSLARLSRPATAKGFHEGPVEYVDVTLANEQQLSCIKRSLILLKEGERSIALLVQDERHSHRPTINLEVMADDRETAERFVRRLTRETRQGPAFRGNVLSIEENCYGISTVKFHRLPQVGRDEIILPRELLERIERHTISFSRHGKRLLAAKRHLKRGILMFGPPGTGKTLSAMYLAAQMPGRSVLMLTGQAMGGIETACRLARMLEPATVILEDADLIGTERGHQTVAANALLFELLNQMDGLAEDADILFILTTNRPEILEPALASRPGRIDQAIEVPVPDAECRHRLIELYGRGLELKIGRMDHLIRRLEGVSAAFIRELLRRAAVYAAESQDDNEPLCVRDEHIDEAISELLVVGGLLTQSLLGGQPPKKRRKKS